MCARVVSSAYERERARASAQACEGGRERERARARARARARERERENACAGGLTRFTPCAGDGAEAGPLWLVARRGNHLLLILTAVPPSGCTLRAHPPVPAFLLVLLCVFVDSGWGHFSSKTVLASKTYAVRLATLGRSTGG